jgi:hypothetical protein
LNRKGAANANLFKMVVGETVNEFVNPMGIERFLRVRRFT